MTAITLIMANQKLHLTEHFNVGQVDGVDNHKEGCRRSPSVGPPIPELDTYLPTAVSSAMATNTYSTQ